MAPVSLQPSYEEFCRLAERGNVVPVYADIIADGDTPVSAFRKLEEGGLCFLFESAEQKEGSGRYSFLGFYPRVVMQSDGRSFSIEGDGRRRSSPISNDPLVHLEEVMSRFQFVAAPELPRFAGGAVGFLGYDVVRSFEPTVPSPDKDELNVPEMLFMVMSFLVVFDHRERRMKLIANAFLDSEKDPATAYATAQELIESAFERLSLPCELSYIDAQRKGPPAAAQSNMSRERFETALRGAKVPPFGGDRVTVTKRVVIQ